MVDFQTTKSNLNVSIGNKFKVSSYEWYNFWGLDTVFTFYFYPKSTEHYRGCFFR